MPKKRVISNNKNLKIIILLLIAVISSSIYYIDNPETQLLKSPVAEDELSCTEEVCEECYWRGTKGNKDACIFDGPGMVCRESGDGEKKYCCDGKDAANCKCDKEIKNPCENEKDCLAAMCYAEAAGETGACKKAIACTKKNRKDSKDFPDDYCKIISQGADNNEEPLQYKPYRCICQENSNPNGNNRYCQACKGELIDNPSERRAFEECKKIAEDIKKDGDAACKGNDASYFYTVGGKKDGNGDYLRDEDGEIISDYNPGDPCAPVCGAGNGGKRVDGTGCDEKGTSFGDNVFCSC